MLVFVVPEMLLRVARLMLAIARCRRPGELDGKYQQQQKKKGSPTHNEDSSDKDDDLGGLEAVGSKVRTVDRLHTGEKVLATQPTRTCPNSVSGSIDRT